MVRSRKQHLYWSKRRAFVLLRNHGEAPGVGALIHFFIKDLEAHEKTKDHDGISLGKRLFKFNRLNTLDKMRSFIEAHR